MNWLKKKIFGSKTTRRWDSRAERRNQHCGSKECLKPGDGCLCVCKSCRGEWQKEIREFHKELEENWEDFKLARDVHCSSQRPSEALNARRGPGSPEPGSMEWVKVMGTLAGMNESYNSYCKIMAARMHAMAREVASAEDALRCRREAERWGRGGPLADEGTEKRAE
jgi:hypothetical protein